MENGHWLQVNGLPNHPDPRVGYGAMINLGGHPETPWAETQHERIPLAPFATSGPHEEIPHLRRESFPSREQAMRFAEDHYRKLFPIGTNTGPHDSGVDYSDLNSFKDYL